MVTHFNFMGSHYCSVVKYSIATVKGLLELLLQEAGGKKKRNRKTRLRLNIISLCFFIIVENFQDLSTMAVCKTVSRYTHMVFKGLSALSKNSISWLYRGRLFASALLQETLIIERTQKI